jgi:hypothetical protein
MKKLIALTVSALVLTPAFVMAGTHGNHGMAGCGLGYMVMRDDNSKGMQILAATTNDAVFPQTSAITSGTSGCTEDGAYKVVKAAQAYAEVNMDTLRHEMANGQGEFVTTFASMLGVRDQKIPAVVSVFQQNYSVIFPTESITPSEFMETVTRLLAVRQDLLS